MTDQIVHQPSDSGRVDQRVRRMAVLFYGGFRPRHSAETLDRVAAELEREQPEYWANITAEARHYLAILDATPAAGEEG